MIETLGFYRPVKVEVDGKLLKLAVDGKLVFSNHDQFCAVWFEEVLNEEGQRIVLEEDLKRRVILAIFMGAGVT